MNKMLVWFHSFPEGSEMIIDSQLFEKINLSAFKADSDNAHVKKLFNGDFNEFIDFIVQNDPYHDVEVILPASEVLYTKVSVPSQSRNRILLALPFLLDDFLINDINKQHFALGDIKPGQCHVAIIKHSIIEKIFAQFKKMALPVSVMTSEIFQLPWYENKWSIGFLQDDFIVRTGKQSGVSNNSHNIDFIFRLLLSNLMPKEEQSLNLNNDASNNENSGNNDKQQTSETGLPDSFIIYTSEDDTEAVEKITTIAQEYLIETEIVKNDPFNFSLSDNTLAVKRKKTKKTGSARWGINLLQGQYLSANLRQVKIPFQKSLVAVFVLCFFSQLFFMGYQWTDYKNSLNRLETELEQLFFKTFPDSKRLVDVRTQTESKLGQLQKKTSSNHSFLNLLGLVGDEIQRNKGIEIQTLRYNDGILQIDVLSKGFIFNQLKSNLEKKQGMAVEEKSSSRIKGEVHSVLSFKLNKN